MIFYVDLIERGDWNSLDLFEITYIYNSDLSVALYIDMPVPDSDCELSEIVLNPYIHISHKIFQTFFFSYLIRNFYKTNKNFSIHNK